MVADQSWHLLNTGVLPAPYMKLCLSSDLKNKHFKFICFIYIVHIFDPHPMFFLHYICLGKCLKQHVVC